MIDAKALHRRHTANFDKICTEFLKEYKIEPGAAYQVSAIIYGACIIAEALRNGLDDET